MARNAIDLSGRVAVVTGGAQGIGRAIAERLAESGAEVAIWDMDEVLASQTASEIGPRASAYGLDVPDAEAVARAAQALHAERGRIDIPVTSAGIAGPTVPLWEYPLEAWRRVMAVNVDGTFHSARAVVPFMR